MYNILNITTMNIWQDFVEEPLHQIDGMIIEYIGLK